MQNTPARRTQSQFTIAGHSNCNPIQQIKSSSSLSSSTLWLLLLPSLHSSTFQMQETNDLVQCAEKSMRSLMRFQCKVCSKSNEIIKVQLTIYWCTFRARNSNNMKQHSKITATSHCTARFCFFFRWIGCT